MKTRFVFAFTWILFTLPAIAQNGKAQQSMFEHFVTRSGAKLLDGDRELRFISFNIPNLNYIEDEFGYEQPQPFRLPDAFEIRDALLSAKQMGGDVVRLYTIPVRSRHDHPETPAYVLGPGIFDEEAFRALDLVLSIANEVGVRVIIPFINNWQWMGGRPQYADFRGKANDDFWSDPQLMNDAKATISYVINRVNTITGTPYKEDKAIFCWETGNELTCPESWTAEICRFIKQLDSNHLVMDGYFAIDLIPVRKSSLSDPNVDIISSHHYETDPSKLMAHINRNLAIVGNEKPYVLGEFGFISNGAMRQVLDYVIQTGMPGALLWSLRFHRREGGFYWHSEPSGHGRYKAYLWPGFDTGINYDEKNTLALMREKAYAIKGLPMPPVPVPAPPKLLPIPEVSRISWQGATGASSYDVERAANPEGPWEMVGYNISDASNQYFPLFNDRSAQKGQVYYYRVIAKNQSGSSKASNVVGPVGVSRLALVDDMQHFGSMYNWSGDVHITRGEDRECREKLTRLQGKSGDKVTYYLPEGIKGFKVFAFSKEKKATLCFAFSAQGDDRQAANPAMMTLPSSHNDYQYWHTAIYSDAPPPNQTYRYLEIKFDKTTQIARVEIYY